MDRGRGTAESSSLRSEMEVVSFFLKMGVIGLTKYLETRKGKEGIDAIGFGREVSVMISGDASINHLNKDNELPAVMDGNAFESSVFELVRNDCVSEAFSYQKVYDKAKSILETLNSCHVKVKGVFVDGIEDPDKADEKKDRHEKKSKGNKKLLSILKNNPTAKCEANTSISLVSRYAVKNAIKECYPNVQFFSGGVDCDR